jgi:predicted ATP-grasp superfamily ATP-dependent carboligase/SAM-dependent methyltransferase
LNTLSIGAGKEQLKSIQIAKELGLKVVACDGDPNAVGLKYADFSYNIDIKDEDSIIKLAKKYDIKFVLPAPLGRYLTTVGAVNDALNLKGVSKKSANYATDKYLFYQKLSKEIKLAKQFLIYSANEIKDLIENRDISTPFILKPRFGSGSKGVEVFEDFDYQRVKNYFSENSNFKDILIEELLVGDEIGVDAIIRNKKLDILAIRDKKITPLPYRQELAYVFPSKYQSKESEIEKIIKKCCELLKIDNSLLNLDIIINKNDIYIIELSPRASGNNISNIFLPIARKINPLSFIIRYYMGENRELKLENTPIYLEFFNFKDKDVGKKIKDVREFKDIKSLHSYKLGLKIGDTISSIKSGQDAMNHGYFIITQEDNMKNIEDIKESIYTNIEVEDIDKINQEAWSKEIRKNIMLYPDTYIVSFLARNFPDKEQNKKLKALDIGFGSGRNLRLLKDYNFQTYGIDYSQEACNVAKEIFDLTDSEISCIDLKDKPFSNKKFDVILMYGLIFFRNIARIREDLKILYNNLKPSGKMIINFRTKDDFLFGQGRKIDKHTYILDHPNYKDICYTFLDLHEVKELLIDRRFIIENISRVDYHKNNLTEHHSWWIVEVTKK